MTVEHETQFRFRARWAVKDADEIRAAQVWLRETSVGPWRAEMIGLESGEGPSDSSDARVLIRYAFEHESDCILFVDRFDGAEIEGAPVVPTEPPADSPSDANGERFGKSVLRILAGPTPVSAGRLQLLGLDRVRAHFGNDWARLQPKIEATVTRAIERRLGPRDVFRNAGSLNYTILFSELTHEEARFKCRMMVDEISRLLIGEDMREMIDIQTVAAEIDTAKVLEHAEDPDRIAAVIETIVEDEQRRQVAAACAGFEIREDADPLSDVRISYRPIWDVRRSVVARFHCVTVRSGPGGAMSAHDVSAMLKIDEAARLKVDSLTLDQAIDDLAVMHRNRRRLMISIPVHFESISSPTRRRNFLDPWERVPTAYQQLAAFEIIEWPDGVPQGRVAEIVSALKPISGGVMARVPIGALTIRNFANAGLVAIGNDLSSSQVAEEYLTKEFRKFVQAAEMIRLLSFIHGLNTFSLALAAITSGYSYVDGAAISSTSERPDTGYRLSLEDLYAGVLPRARE